VQLTIIGAGAIGGTVGAHMARDGHEVLLCDVDADHVDAINSDGLSIEGPVEQFTVLVPAVLPKDLPEHLGAVAVAVKGHHTEAAAALIGPRLDREGYVVSLQNGLTSDVLAAAVGSERVVAGFVNFGADLLAPGRILQGNAATVRVGELRGGVTPRVEELAASLPYAQATDNVLGYLWGKEAYGAMLWAGAVSDLSIADSLEDARWRPLMLAVAREVLAQAPVRPEAFDGFDPADLEGSLPRLAAFNRASAKTHSGIYRDLVVRRRKTEVDSQLGHLAGPLTTSIAELIRAIEQGRRRCEVANLELLATYERTRRVDPPLHAVVHYLDAPPRAADGPLHGLAIAVKDIIAVAGTPMGNGNPNAMADAPQAADAPVVAALRQAGADVYVTTSLLEYAAGATHPDVPEAMNPHDPSRTAGGSSGGSAALVGAGACRVALGTDTGGSIRIPAAYCGTVGFKPSYGSLPLEGVYALAPSLDHVGLLAADVAVTSQVFSALTRQRPVPAPDTVRVGVLADQLAHRAVTEEVRRTTQIALDRLGASCRLVEVDSTPMAALLETFGDIILWEAWQVHRQRVEREPDHFGPATLRLLRSASAVDRGSYDRAMERRASLLPPVAAMYDGLDVLAGPAVPFVAPATTPPIDTPEGEDEGLFSGVYNLTGAPALSLPCGTTSAGLPVGLQLSAPLGRDMALLAAAARLEGLLGSPVDPAATDPTEVHT
jgi:2-dehydropantoate 2-reductase